MNKHAMKNELDMIDLALLSTNNKASVSGKSERKVASSIDKLQNSSKKA